jgi:hypothetical protein
MANMNTTSIPRPAVRTTKRTRRPFVVEPLAVYFAADLAGLGFKVTTIRSEKRAGRLRVGRRLGRNFVLGEWLIEWLREAELPQNNRPASS